MNDYTFTFHGVPPGSPVVIHLPDDQGQVLKRLDAIADLINQRSDQIMNTLDQVVQGETDEGSAIAVLGTSLQTLIAGQATLQQQLADALNGVTVSPAVQAKIDAAIAGQQANITAIQADIAAIPVPAAAS